MPPFPKSECLPLLAGSDRRQELLFEKKHRIASLPQAELFAYFYPVPSLPPLHQEPDRGAKMPNPCGSATQPTPLAGCKGRVRFVGHRSQALFDGRGSPRPFGSVYIGKYRLATSPPGDTAVPPMPTPDIGRLASSRRVDSNGSSATRESRGEVISVTGPITAAGVARTPEGYAVGTFIENSVKSH